MLLKDHGLLLLKCSGSITANLSLEARQALCGKIWQALNECIVGMDLQYYHTYVKVCTENRIVLEFKKFLAEMKVKPTQETYYLLLENAARSRSALNTLGILAEMKNLRVPLNERVFNALILNQGLIG